MGGRQGAERALSQRRIILVANGAHYPGPVALPFDWRHRSGAKVYTLKDGATKEEIKAEQTRFAEVLKSCIIRVDRELDGGTTSRRARGRHGRPEPAQRVKDGAVEVTAQRDVRGR